MKTRSPVEWEKLKEWRRDEKNVIDAFYQMKPLYSQFKELASKHQLSIRAAIREAVYIWVHKEETTEDMNRYACVLRDIEDIMGIVKSLARCKDGDEVWSKIRYLIEFYS